nr:hypothetical protein [uncultured bacterium]
MSLSGMLLTSAMWLFFAVNTHQKRAAKKTKNISSEMIGYISTPSIFSRFPFTNFNIA